ncbi:hypothetical protein [Methylobacterium sp. J-077]|uniref:hypothetical protein n=1 Tax=Methylobacterium sp. J-077 TaxID=2836656 RepID=UPI001FB8733E|nr:hypothetical protein [Methylobacterium sp. J-077]MCJ2126317.1 hypothetical protein [Methylobacterium sp. J-077]
MTSVVSSSSAALKVLQTQAPSHAVSGQNEQDPLKNFLDPRSVLALAPQSLDALLKLRTELRRDPVQQPQALKDVSLTPHAGTRRQSGMLAWENEGTTVETSNLDIWTERMERLKARTSEPLNSPLMPWNSADVLQQLRDLDRHAGHSDARKRAFFASDAAIYKGMAETPPEDVAQIKSLGGEIWYNDKQFYDRPSDKEFFRDIKNLALYGGNLDQPIDPSDELSQALLKGTAQMIRGSNIPEYHVHSASYTMYAYSSAAGQYKWIGGWGGGGESNSHDILEGLIKKNPTMHVAVLGADNDIAFVLYPKSGSATPTVTAAAQGSATGTGTSPGATPAR